MEDIRRLIVRAGRRLGFNEFIGRLHLVAVVIAAVALVVVLAQKVTPVLREALAWSWFGAVLAALTLAAAAIWWMQRRPSPLHVAIEVDDRLGLREKLSTAMLCRGREDPFAQAAIDDAINVARKPQTREEVDRKFAVRPPERWWVSPSIVIVAALVGIFAPNGDLFAGDETALTPEQEKEIVELETEVEEAIREVAEELNRDPKEIADMLAEASRENPEDAEIRDPEEVRRDAFRKMSALQDELKKAEAEKSEMLRELSSKLSMLRPEEGPGSELSKSLANGDFQGAQKALEKLKADLENGNLTEDQKEQAAAQLEQLAEQLDKLAQQNQALENMLKQAGIDPAAANDPQALQQAIENAQNLSPAEKQQMQQAAQAMAQANQMMQGMSQSAQSMAAQMGMNGQLGAQGAQSMSSQLSQLEMMQAQMQSMNAKLAGLAGQCNKIGQGMGACQGQGQGIGQNQAMASWMQQMQQGGRGPGMGNRGQGAGGRATRFGTQMTLSPDQVPVENQGGPIIGESFIEGEQIIRGESAETFKELVSGGRSRADEELNENLIPAQYKEAIQHYFGELEAKAQTAEVEVPAEPTGDDG
ncbi:MAG: hypothetical protein ACF8PN_08965 [Phycisphaerales bacterium]